MYPRLTAITVALLLLSAPVAHAMTTNERGAALVHELRTGTVTCSAMTPSDLGRIGTYVMVRGLGSTAAGRAVNTRMITMLGAPDASEMRQFLGRRYSGCLTHAERDGGGPAMMGGSGMMTGSGPASGYAGTAGIGAMMRSDGWNWMMTGAWRGMTRQDWKRREQSLLRPTASEMTGGSWGARTILAAALAAVVVAVLSAFLIIRRPLKRPPTASMG